MVPTRSMISESDDDSIDVFYQNAKSRATCDQSDFNSPCWIETNLVVLSVFVIIGGLIIIAGGANTGDGLIIGLGVSTIISTIFIFAISKVLYFLRIIARNTQKGEAKPDSQA